MGVAADHAVSRMLNALWVTVARLESAMLLVYQSRG